MALLTLIAHVDNGATVHTTTSADVTLGTSGMVLELVSPLPGLSKGVPQFALVYSGVDRIVGTGTGLAALGGIEAVEVEPGLHELVAQSLGTHGRDNYTCTGVWLDSGAGFEVDLDHNSDPFTHVALQIFEPHSTVVYVPVGAHVTYETRYIATIIAPADPGPTTPPGPPPTTPLTTPPPTPGRPPTLAPVRPTPTPGPTTPGPTTPGPTLPGGAAPGATTPDGAPAGPAPETTGPVFTGPPATGGTPGEAPVAGSPGWPIISAGIYGEDEPTPAWWAWTLAAAGIIGVAAVVAVRKTATRP